MGTRKRRQEAVAHRLDLAAAEAASSLRTSASWRASRSRQRPSPSSAARAVASTMSVNITVSSARASSPPPRPPVRNSSISSTIASLSPTNGSESTPFQLDIAGSRDVLGQVTRVAWVPGAVTGSVHDQRRDADTGQCVAHVEVGRGIQEDTGFARARRQALQAREPRRERRVIGHRGRQHRKPGAVVSPQAATVRSVHLARSSTVIAQS